MNVVSNLEVFSEDEWDSVDYDIYVWVEGNYLLIHEIWIHGDGSLNLDDFDGPDAL